ncbi:DUF4123 domain-containing protein [Bremerella volcania]|uniref:DUF4123 domain-containing protein n=1 Tax=Bremerella volcania TaxID=2527984 RepID=UPI0013FD0E2B|nr:DUF4123 domain-containing protein [Bremerella volcania]
MSDSVDPQLLRQMLQFAAQPERGNENLHTYAIVDAAQDWEFVVLCRQKFKLNPQMLFEGRAADAMMMVAPYLIQFDASTEFVEQWSQRWGKNLGIFLISSADETAMRKHARSIFLAEDESGQEYFFRFYDPRVVWPFLQGCTHVERKQFFGDCHCVLCELAGTSRILHVPRSVHQSTRYYELAAPSHPHGSLPSPHFQTRSPATPSRRAYPNLPD